MLPHAEQICFQRQPPSGRFGFGYHPLRSSSSIQELVCEHQNPPPDPRPLRRLLFPPDCSVSIARDGRENRVQAQPKNQRFSNRPAACSGAIRCSGDPHELRHWQFFASVQTRCQIAHPRKKSQLTCPRALFKPTRRRKLLNCLRSFPSGGSAEALSGNV